MEAKDFVITIPNVKFRTWSSNDDFRGMVNVRKSCIEKDQVDTASYLEHFLSEKEMAETITKNHTDPTRDVLIIEIDEVMVGYCHICWWAERDGTWLGLHVGYLNPKFRKNGIGTQMINWCEARIQKIVKENSIPGKPLYGANASSTEIDKNEILLNKGYHIVFTQIEMEFNDYSGLKQYTLPHGFEIKPVSSKDLRKIWETNKEVYADRHLVAIQTEEDFQEFAHNPHNDISLWQVAWKENEVAALVLSEIVSGRAEVTEVSTRDKYRRLGLAQALLSASLKNLQQRGISSVRLHTDGGNISGARSLYEKIGFKHLKDYIRYRKAIY